MIFSERNNCKKLFAVTTGLMLLSNVAFAGEPFGEAQDRPVCDAPAKFTKAPTAKKAGQAKNLIEFAVSEPTDVAVYILDAKGDVVRHLVAGVLGDNGF